MKVTQLGPALGAEISGIDLSQPLTDKQFACIDAAIAEHLVVCFRGQRLQPEQQIAFTSRWGAVEPHPLGSRADSHPAGMPRQVMVAMNTMKVLPSGDKTGTVRNDIWHTDLSCMEHPVGLSVLHAVEVPPPGWGDTMFSNQQRAYDTLPEDQKSIVDTLDAIHDTSHFEGPARKETFKKSACSVHPVVRRHPVTGRDALYISMNFLNTFQTVAALADGAGTTKYDRARTLTLLKTLVDHSTKPENVYRHRWLSGDVIMWDNRATMHYACFDYLPGQTRTLHRTTSAGERPFRGSKEKVPAARL